MKTHILVTSLKESVCETFCGLLQRFSYRVHLNVHLSVNFCRLSQNENHVTINSASLRWRLVFFFISSYADGRARPAWMRRCIDFFYFVDLLDR